MNIIGTESVKQFVYSWSTRFPVDLWWRKKYNISFNSPAHRQSNFIDQYIEFIENKMLNEEVDKKEKYQPGNLNWMKPKVYSDEEIKDIFNTLDLDNLDKI